MKQGTECISPAFLSCSLHCSYTRLFQQEQSWSERAHREEVRFPADFSCLRVLPWIEPPTAHISFSLIQYYLWQAAAFKVRTSSPVILSLSSPASREMCELQRSRASPEMQLNSPWPWGPSAEVRPFLCQSIMCRVKIWPQECYTNNTGALNSGLQTLDASRKLEKWRIISNVFTVRWGGVGRWLQEPFLELFLGMPSAMPVSWPALQERVHISVVTAFMLALQGKD